jgi:ADP-heptose:LPS heptosyltransferase
VDIGDSPTIIILMLAHLGDFVVSLRELEIIRNGFPRSKITVVTAPWTAEWARMLGYFSEVFVFDFFPALNRDWRGPTKITYNKFSELPLGAYDIAIDLRHDSDTRPCLYRVNARFRIGYQAPPEANMPYLDLALPAVENIVVPGRGEFSLHAGLRLENLAFSVVKAFLENTGNCHPALNLVKNNQRESDKSYAIIAMSAGDTIRYWPIENYKALAEALIRDYDLDIVLVGGPAEADRINHLKERLSDARVRTAIGIPWGDLPTFTARARAFIGLGTGVTHLSTALGVPTVALLSGVSPLQVWRPLGPKAIALTGLMPCSPCGLRDESRCPFGVACLRTITPADVIEVVRELLAASSPIAR